MSVIPVVNAMMTEERIRVMITFAYPELTYREMS